MEKLLYAFLSLNSASMTINDITAYLPSQGWKILISSPFVLITRTRTFMYVGVLCVSPDPWKAGMILRGSKLSPLMPIQRASFMCCVATSHLIHALFLFLFRRWNHIPQTWTAPYFLIDIVFILSLILQSVLLLFHRHLFHTLPTLKSYHILYFPCYFQVVSKLFLHVYYRSEDAALCRKIYIL